MPSPFATENGHKIARLLKYYEGPPYNIPEILDAELQEVREVLSDLLGFAETEGDDQSETCIRARAMVARLRVDGGKENDGNKR
jgi:hypothetical protein